MEERLVQAALNGDLNEIRELLSQGADIDVSNGAPLHRASYAGHTDVVEYLLSQKADPNAGNARTIVPDTQRLLLLLGRKQVISLAS